MCSLSYLSSSAPAIPLDTFLLSIVIYPLFSNFYSMVSQYENGPSFHLHKRSHKLQFLKICAFCRFVFRMREELHNYLKLIIEFIIKQVHVRFRLVTNKKLYLN